MSPPLALAWTAQSVHVEEMSCRRGEGWGGGGGGALCPSFKLFPRVGTEKVPQKQETDWSFPNSSCVTKSIE